MAPKGDKVKWDEVKTSNVKSKKEGDTLSVDVPFTEGGSLKGTLKVTVTEDRALRLVWIGEPDSLPLSGFEAWSNG